MQSETRKDCMQLGMHSETLQIDCQSCNDMRQKMIKNGEKILQLSKESCKLNAFTAWQKALLDEKDHEIHRLEQELKKAAMGAASVIAQRTHAQQLKKVAQVFTTNALAQKADAWAIGQRWNQDAELAVELDAACDMKQVMHISYPDTLVRKAGGSDSVRDKILCHSRSVDAELDAAFEAAFSAELTSHTGSSDSAKDKIVCRSKAIEAELDAAFDIAFDGELTPSTELTQQLAATQSEVPKAVRSAFKRREKRTLSWPAGAIVLPPIPEGCQLEATDKDQILHNALAMLPPATFKPNADDSKTSPKPSMTRSRTQQHSRRGLCA